MTVVGIATTKHRRNVSPHLDECQWNGSGMGVEWEWNGSGMGVEWEWNESGMGVE